MLKIKDNIDLKELEKYGFKKRISTNIFDTDDYSFVFKGKYHESLTIIYIDSINNRTINIQTNLWVIKDFDLLYDLIIAGLVEKVKECYYEK